MTTLSVSPKSTAALSLRDNAWVFLSIFIFTLVEDWLVRQVFLPYLLPAMHAGLGFMTGDSIGYHEFAVGIAKRIRLEGWSVWQLRPGSDIFTLAAPSGIASAIYAVFGVDPLFLLPLNAAIHAASAVLLLGMLQAIFQNKLVSVIGTLPFILFPTAISWHSQLSKDGIFILGIYAHLASWIMAADVDAPLARRSPLLLLTASTGLLIVWVVRPYMLVVLTSTIIMFGTFLIIWTVAQKRRAGGRPAQIFGLVLFTASLLVITFAINKTDARPGMSEWTGQELKNSVYSGRPLGNTVGADGSTIPGEDVRSCQGWTDSPFVPIAVSRLASKLVIVRGGYYDEIYTNAGSTIDQDICITSLYDLIGFLPRATQVGLLAPFPSQWIDSKSHGGGVSRIIAGLEMIFTYVALLALVCYGRRFWHHPEFWLILAFGLFMIDIYALVTPNIGALHRMRYGFLMLLVGMGLGALLLRFRFGNSPDS